MIEAMIPTEEEIGELPLHAQVAFAARCARRVLPLFKYYWPEAPMEHIDAVEKAVEVAEQNINTIPTSVIEKVTGEAAKALVAISNNASTAKNAVNAARYAVNSVRNAAYESVYDDIIDVIRCSIASSDDNKVWQKIIIRNIRYDFEKIIYAMKDGSLPEGHVPPEFFGEMWQEGEPIGWPEAVIYLTDDDGNLLTDGKENLIIVDEAFKETFNYNFNELSRSARAAFSARCARRFIPLFKYYWPDVSQEHIDILDGVVSAAEHNQAAIASIDLLPAVDNKEAAKEKFAIEAIINAAVCSSRIITIVNDLSHNSDAEVTNSSLDIVELFVESVNTIIDILSDNPIWRDAVVKEIWRDISKLKKADVEDVSPEGYVSPEFFGEMWPEGMPKGWPGAEDISIPTKEEIGKLPPQVQISFVARCLKRILPLFKYYWGEVSVENLFVVENAVDSLGSKLNMEEAENIYHDVRDVAAIVGTLAKENNTFDVSAYIARAVSEVANSIAYSIGSNPNYADASIMDSVDAIGQAVKQNIWKKQIEKEILLDFEKLKKAMEEGSLPKKHISPEFFGELWSEGKPEGWPGEEKKSEWQSIDPMIILLDPGSATEEEIGELFSRLSRFYKTLGGSGLEFRALDVSSGVAANV